MSSYRSVPRDYPIQIESDEEREALIIDPDKQVVRKVSKFIALNKGLSDTLP